MFWVILIIAIILIVYFSKTRKTSETSATTTEKAEKRSSSTAISTNSISAADLRKTELIRDIQNIFTDLSHAHMGGRLLIGLRKDEKGTKWITFVMFFVDDLGLYNLVIASSLNAFSEGRIQDIEEALQKCNWAMLGTDYTPVSEMFEIPDIYMYKKQGSSFAPIKDGDGTPDGFYVPGNLIIGSVSLREVDNPLSFDESKTVDDRLVLDEIRRIAAQTPNLTLTETLDDGMWYDVAEVDS